MLALLLFLFPLAYSPGPGNMLFAANGARFGLRATVPANLGYHVATWIVAISLGMGFARLTSGAPWVFDVLRWTGACYVVWLAVGLWNAGALEKGSEARPLGPLGGVALLILNPKAYVIMGLMFTQFLGDARDLRRVVEISTIFTANNFVAFLAWTMAGDRLAGLFGLSRQARVINRLLAATLMAVAGWMAHG